jgi:hypothetical protein
MTYNIIKTDNYLLVVDDSEIKEGDYYLFNWYAEKDIQKFTYVQYSDREKNKYLYEQSCKKIIAHLPLKNSPILEGVDLLPPIEDDGCKDLFYSKQVMNPYSKESQSYTAYEKGFIDGYNKAKEKYKYTEEDIRKAIDMARMNYDEEGFTINAFTEYEIIKSLQQPKMPVGFEFEINNPMFALTIEPKTTTNSQSQTVWVGKYIFN